MNYMSKERPDLSVVVLVYKETRSVIESFVEDLKRSIESKGISYQIVLVSNYYENDKTEAPKIVQELSSSDIRITSVTKIKQGGYGFDVRSGFEVATGNTVSFIDGDGQMPAEDVVRVYEKLKETGVDMAQTFRVKRMDNLERLVISRIFNFLLKILFPNVHVLDANSKPKIFTRSALEKLHLSSLDWFIDAEILIHVIRHRRPVVRVSRTDFNLRRIISQHGNDGRLAVGSARVVSCKL